MGPMCLRWFAKRADRHTCRSENRLSARDLSVYPRTRTSPARTDGWHAYERRVATMLDINMFGVSVAAPASTAATPHAAAPAAAAKHRVAAATDASVDRSST